MNKPSADYILNIDPKGTQIKVLQPNVKGCELLLYEDQSFPFVVKVVPISKYYFIEKEFNLLRQFPHLNIIRAFTLSNDKSSAFMTLEYAKFLDLINFLSIFNDKICSLFKSINTYEKFFRSLFWQILSAFSFLQENGVAHGDIKPDNILINENLEVKIADFEFATQLEPKSTGTMTSAIAKSSKKYKDNKICEKIWGTKDYFSPELREKKFPYDPIKSDVFSLGITFLNLLSGKNLFCSKDQKTQLRMRRLDLIEVLKEGVEKIWCHFPLGRIISSDFKKMVEKMLVLEPEERWSFDEVIRSKWMQRERFSSEEMRNMFQGSPIR